MKDLYIYYRARCENAQALQSAVHAMQRRLAQEYAVAGALKRHPEQQQGCHTWMEVYLAAPDGFETRLEHAVAQSGLGALIEGPRHIEYFLDFSPCA